MAATSTRVVANLRVRGLLELLNDVCTHRGITRHELCGRARTRAVSRARHELWCLIFEHPERSYSLSEIARLFDRDHSTVLDGIQTHRRRMADAR